MSIQNVVQKYTCTAKTDWFKQSIWTISCLKKARITITLNVGKKTNCLSTMFNELVSSPFTLIFVVKSLDQLSSYFCRFFGELAMYVDLILVHECSHIKRSFVGSAVLKQLIKWISCSSRFQDSLWGLLSVKV